MGKNYFEELSAVNVGEHTEKKNGLTYLSWAWAWLELKKRFPKSFCTVYENKDGWNYFTDGRTAWVKTGVTIVMDSENGEYRNEHIEYLPIMDNRNNSIPVEKVTSFDANKAIQRSMTKALAKVSGLGLYIYAGEDLPEEEQKEIREAEKKEKEEQIRIMEMPVTKTEINTLKMSCKAKGSDYGQVLSYLGVDDERKMTKAQWNEVMKILAKKKDVEDGNSRVDGTPAEKQ